MTLGTLSVVVLNWRTPQSTVRAVQALLDDGVPPGRIVIVDNASGDDSAERLNRDLPEIWLLELEENVGFARGNNRGAVALPGDAYLFVNSDAFVHAAGSVERLIRALDDPEVGIAVPRLRNEDLTLQPSVVPISTPLPEFVRAAGISRLMPNRLRPTLSTRWDHSETRRIQAAIGAVLLVRGSTWIQLDGFDDARFMYAEDHDLFRRAARSGWAAQFVAEAEFIHLGGESSKQLWGQPQRAERVAQAEAAMIREHLGPARAWLTIGLMAAGAGLRAVVHRLRGDRIASQTMAAWFRGYAGRSSAGE